jgi:pimeloyl-ACP methyl ester carboxylesterase
MVFLTSRDVFMPVEEHKVNRGTKGLAVVAALVALVALPTAGAAIVLPNSPATVLTVFPWEGSLEDELQGFLCQAPNTCVQVDTFLWDPDAVTAIETAIDTTPDTKIVFGYSQGAVVVTRWLEQHADDPDAPSPDELSFVLIGNSTRAYGGANARSIVVMPQTQYQVIDVARQYDMAADFPDNPFNLLALANALAGFTFIHIDYEGVDINDPANAVWTEGNTTYILVPTQNLPLLEPLRMIGLTAQADALNGPLKEIVEQGYNRPVPFPTTTQPVTVSSPAQVAAVSQFSPPSARQQSVAVQDSVATTANTQDSQAQPPAAHPASTATGPEKANGTGKGVAVADTVTTTTPPDPAHVLGTVKTITPPAAQPGLDNAIEAKRSTTAPTTHITAASTADGYKVEPGKVGENQATTKSGDQAPSTEDSEKAAHSDG